jgi:hypothetical protein
MDAVLELFDELFWELLVERQRCPKQFLAAVQVFLCPGGALARGGSWELFWNIFRYVIK